MIGGMIADTLCGTTNFLFTSQGGWCPPWAPPLADWNSDPALMISNALFATNAGGVPTNWSLGAVTGTATSTANTIDSLVLGNVWQVTLTSSGVSEVHYSGAAVAA